jgi:hypothetical protein
MNKSWDEVTTLDGIGNEFGRSTQGGIIWSATAGTASFSLEIFLPHLHEFYMETI